MGRRSGPRLLHRQLGYTSRIEKALPSEPEAISAAEQERMSQRARDAERARTRDAWTDANRQINDAVSTFRERTGHVSPNVRSGVRAVLRASEQVGRKLAR